MPQLFADTLGRPVLLETDVNAAGWGQWRQMEPRPPRLVYLSLGTGVGGSVILDGQIVRHTRGGGGHFGFLIVDTSPNAPADHAGLPGCLEAVLRESVGTWERGKVGTWERGKVGTWEGGNVGRWERGNVGTWEGGNVGTWEGGNVGTWEGGNVARGLAVTFVNLVHIYAPNVIALGGGVSDHHPEIVAQARAAFGQYRGRLIPPGIRIERAALPTHQAGVIGATLLARQADANK